MNEAIVKKLRMAPREKILILGAPKDYLKKLSALPEGASLHTTPDGTYKFVHLFVKSIEELNTLGPVALRAIEYDGLLWISYPKKTSKIKTDINRDQGFESIINEGLEGVTQIAIDETWSALRFRPRTAIKKLSRKKTIGVKQEAAGESVSANKELVIPVELEEKLDQNKEAAMFFQELAPSHKRAYAEWITSAKRRETFDKRLDQTIEKLIAHKKGPYVH
jgi:hypothetical protein